MKLPNAIFVCLSFEMRISKTWNSEVMEKLSEKIAGKPEFTRFDARSETDAANSKLMRSSQQ